ncbi:MAG: heavy-metal-associated domain-containing protein [Phycisphaerales bacterium]|nr:heavy-metal-associated domain-containing protein [Phycisphaerales bacterium]
MTNPHFSSIRAVITLAIVPGLMLLGCASGSGSEHAVEENAVIHTATPEQIAATHSQAPIRGDSATLYVNGLGCPLCASNIDKQLLRLDGIKEAVVDLGAGTVRVGFDPSAKHPSPHDLSETVLDAGFTLVRIEQQ